MSKYISTIGVDFGVRVVVHAGLETKVNLWDLAGSSDLYEVRKEFMRPHGSAARLRRDGCGLLRRTAAMDGRARGTRRSTGSRRALRQQGRSSGCDLVRAESCQPSEQ